MVHALTGKHAVVTGASSGVGLAICRALAAHGAGVSLVGRHADTLQSIADSLRGQAAFAQVWQADLTIADELTRLGQGLGASEQPIDILIHSAGLIALGPIERDPVENLDRQYACNVRAPFVLTQALLPMLKRQKGQVVFLNSTAGVGARANAGAYAASKHGLKAVADSLREEVNSHGIRVLSVFLGRTATPMQAQIFQHEGRRYQPELLLQPEDIAGTIVSLLGLPRTAEVTDLFMRPAIKSY